MSDNLLKRMSEWWEYDTGNLISDAKTRIGELEAKLAEVEADLTAARAALVTARREMQLEAANVAVDYGKVQYSANIERHPQYANDAADDALEIAAAIRALPTMEEKTDE